MHLPNTFRFPLRPAWSRTFVGPIVAVLFALAVTAGFSGCRLLDPKPNLRADDPLVVVPARFLYTRYNPINEWLDEPVRVVIQDTPLTEVFELPVFARMKYRLSHMPVENPEVNIYSNGMSRRQILWSIAHENGLRMTPVYRGPDQPAYLDIRSKADLL